MTSEPPKPTASAWRRHPSTREGVLGCVIATAACFGWGIPAFLDRTPFDLGLAYHGGQVAWSTGHPETLWSWMSTPFLGVIMAVVSKTMSVNVAGFFLTFLNCALAALLISTTWMQLRSLLPRWLWLATLMAACVFAPTVTSIWWKQFDIPVFALAVGAWWWWQRHPTRLWTVALALSLSIAIKPIAIMLLVVLVIRRQSWPLAARTLALIAGEMAAAMGFLAWRARSVAALSPIASLRNFMSKGTAPKLMCFPGNVSLSSMFCRLSGTSQLNLQKIVVIGGVLLLAAIAFRSVSWAKPNSWTLFAIGCALSLFTSPEEWVHYWILLVPLFLVLVREFQHPPRAPLLWCGLGAGFLLAELVWRPYGTLLSAAAYVLGGTHQTFSSYLGVAGVVVWTPFVVLMVATLRFSSTSRTGSP